MENLLPDNAGVLAAPPSTLVQSQSVLSPATTPKRSHSDMINELLNARMNTTPRLYTRRSGFSTPASTHVISTRMRVSTSNPMRVEVPWTARKKQATNGQVKAFKPNTSFNCCKRRCAAYFDTETAAVKKARQPLFDTSLSRELMRFTLLENADSLLKHPIDEGPVCKKNTALLYSCSPSLLFPNTKRYKGTKGDSNRARSTINLSLATWFRERMKYTDIMPDTGFYQLSEPCKKFVKEQYDEDVESIVLCNCAMAGNAEPCGCAGAIPIYSKCSDSYFNAIWDKEFPDVKIRKHCRFSKCAFCVLQRELRDTHSRNK